MTSTDTIKREIATDMKNAIVDYFTLGINPGSGTLALLRGGVVRDDPRIHPLIWVHPGFFESLVAKIEELPFFVRGEYVQDWVKREGKMTQDEEAFIRLTGFDIIEWSNDFPID